MRSRLFLPLLAALPFAAWASTQIPHTVAQRALASDRVVIAEVAERQTVVEPTNPQAFKTLTTLRVLENVRGTGPDTVTLVQLGGKVGARTVVVPGDADFAVGERAVVFLHCPASDRCYLVSLGEGKLPVVDTNAVVVHDMFTNETQRRPLKALVSELRALPPGKVLGPLAPPAKGATR